MSTEDIAKLREDILHRETSATKASEATGSACARHSRMSELVVTGTLLFVGQYIVRLGSLLELLLSLLIARILVGVILYSGLAVRLFYLVGIGVLPNAQHLIVISFLCHKSFIIQNAECKMQNDFLLSKKFNFAF